MGTHLSEPFVLSRRALLAAGGLGAAALLAGCVDRSVAEPPIFPTIDPASPFLGGRYRAAQVILGETAGTTALPQPFTLSDYPSGQFSALNDCQPNGLDVTTGTPTNVKAAVYYPYSAGAAQGAPAPNPLNVATGPFPVLLFAHAYRGDRCSDAPNLPPPKRDFTTVGDLLLHVASYGCVCVVPDLSWINGVDASTPEAELLGDWELRATVIFAYYSYLNSLNYTLFAQQLDLSRLILVGQSIGGGSVVQAGRELSAYFDFKSLSYGLVSPYFAGLSPVPGITSAVKNLLVLGGSKDLVSEVDRQAAYAEAGTPKTIVEITGGTHFGFTSLCPADNSCLKAGLEDGNGTITLAAQQAAGAAYLAALVRYYALGDETAGPYLSGARQVEGLDSYGPIDIQVQSGGLGPSPAQTEIPQPTVGTHP